jgi:hypothetical protein
VGRARLLKGMCALQCCSTALSRILLEDLRCCQHFWTWLRRRGISSRATKTSDLDSCGCHQQSQLLIEVMLILARGDKGWVVRKIEEEEVTSMRRIDNTVIRLIARRLLNASSSSSSSSLTVIISHHFHGSG